MESKLRKEDVRLADLVSEYLDKYFYAKSTSNFERVLDKERQIEGIDTIFILNDKQYICDEKSGGSRINTNLKTFSLELSFINRGGFRQKGWYLNNELKNNSYLFIWIDAADCEKPKSIDEIHEVEIALVQKNAIKEYLTSKGISDDRLVKIDKTIVSNPGYSMKVRLRDNLGNVIPEYKGKRKYKIDNIDFCHSTGLYEQPLNLILPREVYRSIADYNTIIKT